MKRNDPRGEPYYWIGPYFPTFNNRDRTDFAAYKSGYISMTPLKVEMTHFEVLENYLPENESFADLFKNMTDSE